MSELVAVDKWLYGVLHGDGTLLAAAPGDVHADAAPRGAIFPLVIFAFQDGSDGMGMSGTRLLTQATYQIKVVGEGASYAALDTAAGRMDALLHKASGSVSGGLIYSCVRIEPLKYREDLEGVEYRHLGGFYEVQVQSS